MPDLDYCSVCVHLFIYLFLQCRKTYAYQKLEKKSNNEMGCYLLRESEVEYDEYYIDILLNPSVQGMDKIHTFRIIKDDNDFFKIEDESLDAFPSIPQLISHLPKKIHVNLSRCIPPSEYGKEFLCEFIFLNESFQFNLPLYICYIFCQSIN